MKTIEEEIKEDISRLENLSKLMEIGNSMFTTCFSFDCFAQAVSREAYYAELIFADVVNNLKNEESGMILDYIDCGEDWLKWEKRLKRYAFLYDRAYKLNEPGYLDTWSLWTNEKLYTDEKLGKEPPKIWRPYLAHCPEEEYEPWPEGVPYDLRYKYDLKGMLLSLSSHMGELHEITKIINPQIATDYYDLKHDDYYYFHKNEIEEELQPKLSCVPSVYIKKNTDNLIWEEGVRLKDTGFERFLNEDYNTEKYFYPEGNLDKEAAGKYLAKYTTELSQEQKDAFFRYILVREKVEEFVKEKTGETKAAKSTPKPRGSATQQREEKQHGFDYPVFSKGSGVTDQHIAAVYKHLTSRGWVSTQTQEVDFISLFSGKSNPCEIIWTGLDKQGSNKPTKLGISALYVLFKSMHDEILITSKSKLGPILESHFVDTEGRFVSKVSNANRTSAIANDVIKHILNIMRTRPKAEDIQDWLQEQMDTRYDRNDRQDLHWHNKG